MSQVISRLLSLQPLALGLSTGWNNAARGNWELLYREAEQFNERCLELSALSVDELSTLLSFSSAKRVWPELVSFHGPAKGMKEADTRLVVSQLQCLSHYGHIVMHPDTMGAPSLYRPLGRQLLIENMDARKSTGTRPEQLEALFSELEEARLCLDLAHVKTVDPTMTLGHQLLDCFSERLAEVHLSSVDEVGHHLETVLADVELYAPLLERARQVPWILESVPAE